MKISDFLGLLGGLALFLYGMQMMSAGLEAAAGNRMKRILEKLTANRFLGVLVGAGITAAIQSSSATTVMAVGFVNSGMMTLRQAVWIIMGANIGTTVTGLLIALDVGVLAPLFAFIGVSFVVFLKKPVLHHWGQIIAGLGILFLGMEMMSGAMKPLRESAFFIDLMTKMSNPLLGILVGMLFTAIIQSSSASVGILQTLAASGLIGLPSAVYILFGQNIGTCVTAVLASIGTNRSAKRTTIIHLLFNIIGTTLFTVLCMLTPLTSLVESMLPASPAGQIAAMHTLFNIATTLLLLPFGTQLAKIAEHILPDHTSGNINQRCLMYIKPVDTSREHRIGTSAIVLTGISRELNRMAEIVETNVRESFLTVLDGIPKRLPDVEDAEETIDYLNKEISRYISTVIVHETNERDSAQISMFFKIAGNLERIGDHAMNISEYTKRMAEKNLVFSEAVRKEIVQMQDVSLAAMQLVYPLESITTERLEQIAQLEQKIDDMTLALRQNQIQRMHNGADDESAVLYSELLTDFERIGDHILNIGEAMAQISQPVAFEAV
ncbi:Na/Pi cotransporter family protein [Anaeromassilibacillus senegalensis]|uniref:Na/Pi cotransporter family protein n=1 Tax=Anaeromassilibacillus senegalensis TaxID=1673717 RepID=A0ABS9CRW5_9FIRM|nr:Na/Pi cotransporter family protein [Anaeromassilibacillus senegalensis]MCF2653086.1 Na/Pi cotransporter family protein [Anaeromassilibacillus senegalensis]